MSTLKSDFEYYLANKPEFISKYNGKVVVIKDKKVLGVFDNELKAVEETQKTHPIGTFLVQRVDPANSSTSQTFHSRVAFS